MSAEAGRANVERSVDLVRMALDRSVRMASPLHSTMEGVRLESALERCFDEQHLCGRGIVLVTGDTMLVPPSYRDELYLVLREAIRNALTHAPDSTVQVIIDVSGAMFTAHVIDNGGGLGEAVPAPGRGLGMSSMRERVELLGGVFRAISSPGGGTKVIFELPLPEGV